MSSARLRNERALQTKVLAFVQKIALVENRSPSPFGVVSVPDLTGCYRGRYFAIELKHPRENAPKVDDERWAAQRYFLLRVRAHGGFAMGTNNYEAVESFFDAINDAIALKSSDGFYIEDWRGE